MDYLCLVNPWLNLDAAGAGFTEGSLLKLLNFEQESSGIGPTGSWEVDFNFFEKGLVLFLRGQAAFLINQVESDSGEFFTVLNVGGSSSQFAASRIQESRDKSSWQTTGEIGARIQFRNGLKLQLAASRTGFLDVVLSPISITIPDNAQQAPNGTSALLITKDLIFDSYNAGVAFQF